jgi:DNA-binding MarR family transcriptional regulator
VSLVRARPFRRDQVAADGRESIGIDDATAARHRCRVPGTVPEEARRYAELFRAVYLTYHRRDGPRSGLTGASRAVLEHLAISGPLTVGEAARHLDRAQSVVSEIVDQLADKGLVERERDPADRRRSLVWLTPAGQEALRRDGEVLGLDRLAAALARLPAEQRAALITATAALVAAALPEETR